MVPAVEVSLEREREGLWLRRERMYEILENKEYINALAIKF